MRFNPRITIILFFLALSVSARAADLPPASERNVIIFVADGLRNGAVNSIDTPTMFDLRKRGVYFSNSHALFPTFTTPNASALATGHLLGDTGDFSNIIYVAFPNAVNQSPVPFIENDAILQDVDEHFPNQNMLGEMSLLAAARQKGYHTAAVGKLGPILIQDITQNNLFVAPTTVIVDDQTGHVDASGKPLGVLLPENILAGMKAAKLPLMTPAREKENKNAGTFNSPGAKNANVEQQKFFADVTTKVILPAFANDPINKGPFVLVFWSRDPDGTQHYQGDSFNQPQKLANKLGVGINGPTSKRAVKNADDNLAQLLKYLHETADPAHPGIMLDQNTDLFITSDHGFGTISKHELDTQGTAIKDYSSGFTFHAIKNVGKEEKPSWEVVQDTVQEHIPPGFLAIDLAHEMSLPLFDPDSVLARTQPVHDSPGTIAYVPVDPTRDPEFDPKTGVPSRLQHSILGDGIIGGEGKITFTLDANKHMVGRLDSAAKIIVCANGGSDLIYLPNTRIAGGKAAEEDRDLARRIAKFLCAQPYISGVFVDADLYGSVPGALTLADIGLKGDAQTPVPAMVVNFRTFSTDPKNSLLGGVEVADYPLQEGQGMHGTFSRFDTFNNMTAFGPDFKSEMVDTDPISNADVAITLSHIMGLQIPNRGKLLGRVVDEALKDGPAMHSADSDTINSEPTPEGVRTELHRQTLKDSNGKTFIYFDAAGFPGRTVVE